jgi:ribosomal protein S27AE
MDYGTHKLRRKLPTKLRVRCPACSHQGIVAIMLDDVNKLRCGKCGYRHPIIDQREPLRNWANRRRIRA